MHRREFLEKNLQLLAVALVPPALLGACTKSAESPGAHGAVLAPSLYLAPDGKSTIFSFYDLDRDSLYELPIPLELPHVAITHPVHRNFVFVPESAGRNAVVIDVVERKVVKLISSADGRVFGGHGEFSPDGKFLYATEFEPSGKGFVSVRNTSDFTQLMAFSSHGRYPHDVVLSSDGQSIQVANLGAETGPHVRYGGTFVSRIERLGGKLIERVELNDNASEMNASAIIAGPGDVSRDNEVIKSDARYFISFVSLTRPNSEFFIYPHSHEPIVNLWSTKERRLIREFKFDEQPIALMLMSRRSKACVATKSGQLYFIDIKSRDFDRTLQATKRIKVTTHLSPWSKVPPSYG